MPPRTRSYPSRRAVLALALGAPGAMCAGAQGRQKKESSMEPLFVNRWDETPPLVPEPRPIRPGRKPPSLGRAAPPADRDVVRLFVNDEQNSRLATALGAAPEWQRPRTLWEEELPDWLHPECLLTAAGRLLVRGESGWQLRRRDGSPIQDGPVSAGDVRLDPAGGLFFNPDVTGIVRAVSLEDGREAFTISLGTGRNFLRTLAARRGRLLVTVSVEQFWSEEAPPPTESMVEATDLGTLHASFHEPGGPRVVHELLRRSTALVGAMHGDALTLATDDRFCLLDLDLKVHRALAGSFLPEFMSLDEDGRIYAVVQSNRKRELWLLTPDGEQWYSFRFPPGVRATIGPPAIGLDHTAYLLTAKEILAVGLDGKLNWTRPAGGAIAGAVITGDDQLLVSEGDSVAAYTGKGDRRVLASFPGEVVSAPPLLTERGELLVATGRKLRCLLRGGGAF